MKIIAKERKMQGTGASRRLRKAGRAPGVVYGSGQPSRLISVDHNTLWHALKDEAFHSSILDMEMDGLTGKVLLRDVQVHPFRQQVLHVDFQRVSEKEKIYVSVPLHFAGEDESNAVKMQKCFIDYILTEVEITCLPADLPEALAVDLSSVEAGDTIMLADVKLPEGVELVLRGRNIEDFVVATVVVPTEEKSEDAEEAADQQPAAEGEETAADDAEAEGEGKE